jgi:phosphate transport system protein
MNTSKTYVLDEITNHLLEGIVKMMDATILNHQEAIEALITNNKHLALECIEKDEIVNLLEQSINNDVMISIAKYQPVAGDLRKLIGIMKVASDIERIGDYAKSIAKAVIVNDRELKVSDEKIELLKEMHNVFITLFKKAIEAFVRQDASEVYDIVKIDTKINNLVAEGLQFTKDDIVDDESIQDYLTIANIYRKIERAGDHSKNVCEIILYVQSGMRAEF